MRYYGADNRAVIYIRGCAALRIFIVVPERCVRSRLSGRVPSGIPRDRHRDHPDDLALNRRGCHAVVTAAQSRTRVTRF